jgi:DNA-binding NarL/FixJ family response regulator
VPDRLFSTPPRLTGRAVELEQIARLRTAGAPAVVLEGVLGVGRSRLAREAVVAAQGDWVQATSSAALVPLGAFAALLGDDGRSQDERVAALRERGRHRPFALGVDDAHLLDETSATLLLQLAADGSAFVIATVRSGDPRSALVESLWRDAGGGRLAVGELGASDTSRLVEEWLGGHVEEAARIWAFDTSRGNARYVLELLRGAVADGALVRVRGLWRLRHRPYASRELVELVTARAESAGADVRRALEVLALAGALRPDEASLLLGASALTVAEAHGLVRLADDGYEVAHPLHAEVLRDAMPESLARGARLTLAELVGRRDPFTVADALLVAGWLVDAGEAVPVEILVAAATAALDAGESERAAGLARAASTSGAGAGATILLARALLLRDRFEEAEQVLADAESTFESPDDANAYLEQRVPTLLWGLRRADSARRLLERAREWWPDEQWRRRILPLEVLAHGFGGSLALTSELLAEPGLDAALRRRIEPLHAANLFAVGRAREAHELALAVRPAVPAQTKWDGLALLVWCLIAIETGEDWDGFERWSTDAFARALRAGDEGTAGIIGVSIAMLRVQRARYLDAGRSLAESERHLERHDTFGLRVALAAFQVALAHATDDRDGAEQALGRCRDLVGASAPLPSQRPYVTRAEAWARRAAGDDLRARALFLDAATAEADGPLVAAHAAYEALRAGASVRRIAPLLQELAARCDARVVAAFRAHADARAAADGRALLACAETFEELGARRFATECAADAAGAFAREGRQDSARRAAARSRELLAASQGGAAPVIEGDEGATAGLTSRESQLATLVAHGLSNAEIAAQLGVSVRTVESHVYRAMRKLGVADRHDLVARLG